MRDRGMNNKILQILDVLSRLIFSAPRSSDIFQSRGTCEWDVSLFMFSACVFLYSLNSFYGKVERLTWANSDLMDVEEDEKPRGWWRDFFRERKERQDQERRTAERLELPVFTARFGSLLSSHFICNTARNYSLRRSREEKRLSVHQ